MSLQWTLIASFLYAEIGVVLLLVLPFFSPKRWRSLFTSAFMSSLARQAHFYFAILLFVLVLCFLDAIREMKKYSGTDGDGSSHSHLDAEMQSNMRLFRAQRNFYISGFALFLSLVIRRLVLLISEHAKLLAESEAAMQQAKSASDAAQSLLAQTSSVAQNDTNEAHDREINELKQKLTKAEEEIKKLKKSEEAMKSQALSISEEYDRLLNEVSSKQGSGEPKKDC